MIDSAHCAKTHAYVVDLESDRAIHILRNVCARRRCRNSGCARRASTFSMNFIVPCKCAKHADEAAGKESHHSKHQQRIDQALQLLPTT